jgi:cobalamin synthase
MNASISGHTVALEIPGNIGPLALMGTGVVLIAVAVVAALYQPPRSETTAVSTAVANRRLDAWIFFAILVFAVVLIAFGTSTAQLTGVGALVAACAGAWFRKGRTGEAGPGRTDTGTFRAKFLGIEYKRSWKSDAADSANDETA